MTTLTVTKATGGRAQPADALYVEPDRQVLDASDGTALGETDLNAPFVADLLSACLAHERCGVHLYRSVAGRTGEPGLRERYESFGAETEVHVQILEDLVRAAGGDPQYVSPAARATEMAGAGLVESTFLLGGSTDALTQELAMLEAVVLAETKDRANWQLLARLAPEMPSGKVQTAFVEAAGKVLEEEDQHFGWASDTRARLLFTQATGRSPDDATADGTVDLTRDELYAEAKDLGIQGRSTMTKEELRDAIAAAKGLGVQSRAAMTKAELRDAVAAAKRVSA